MFETSVVKAHAIAARRRAGLFTMSIGFHSMIAVAAIAMSVQTSKFPLEAPRQMASFKEILPVSDPPLPKGNPAAPRTPEPQPQAAVPKQQTAPQVPQPDAAPQTIPDHATALPFDGSSTPGSGTPGTGTKFGVPDGSDDGVDIGQSVPQTPAVATTVYRAVGDVRPARVLSRVEPLYPRAALTAHIAGVVRVECIIDRNGHVSSPRIISSSFGAFDQPVLDALQRWTFTPGTLHGEPVDTYFELTITFRPR